MYPRILIVGTVPYNTKLSSRAFDSYFHYWEPENLIQIFSDRQNPCCGHCKSLYQITDYSLLKKWLHQINEVGRIYNREDLFPEELVIKAKDDTKIESNSYKLGSRHTPTMRLLRGVLWKRKYWCTEQLINWIDSFKPECIFLSFSDDYFIPKIALYIANKYDIPIISSIGDDYYFKKVTTINPLYYLYKFTYKALIRQVLSWKGSVIYISDKIRDKYNEEFGLDGETVYLASTVERKPFEKINRHNPKITYFGNIRMGRNISLCQIGKALSEINPNYTLDVYSNESDEAFTKVFIKIPSIRYRGSVPYTEVKQKIKESDITVIVEGFAPADIEKSRYSLSTKAADSLASGSAILAYGSGECGIIQYIKSTNAAVVCTDKDELKRCIKKLIDDVSLQESYYEQAIRITRQHHNLEESCRTFESIVRKVLAKR